MDIAEGVVVVGLIIQNTELCLFCWVLLFEAAFGLYGLLPAAVRLFEVRECFVAESLPD